MRKLPLLFLVLLFIVATGSVAIAQSLVHYWNFNNSATETDLLTVTSSVVTGAGIQHIQGGTSAIQTTSNTTGQGFETTNPNARNSDAAGAHLRFNNPIGGILVFSLPTTGYNSIVVKYGSRRSTQGAGLQMIEYTTDGTNYTLFDSIAPVDGNPTTQTLDFSSKTAVNNNASFKIRITFKQGSGGTGGNNRFDNFTVEGNTASADVTPPTVTFAPANNTADVDVTTKPTIQFNEPIRLVNNTAIDNTNVDALVELKLNNASGAAVAFDATIAGNIITITPTSAFLNNQQYYVALKANTVEDASDNAVTAPQTASFTTITKQTVLKAGDLVFVAYRMNATSTEDEIALLTLVDILPGTKINFTDSKYTDNNPAQCAGGLVWSSPVADCIPAGTVITIQTNVPATSKGTITGGTFGLSSSGDQVIVYTGTAASPNYITALSSNAWLTANTSCGGSNSKLPSGLTDGQTSLNTSAAPGNTAGNSVNAFYSGIQTGTSSQLKTSVLNPANWTVAGSGTAPQSWPAWSFPGPPTVTGVKVINQTTIQVVFSRDLEMASATNTANFTGINGLSNITQTNNGTLADTLTLTYSTPFTPAANLSVTVANVKDNDGNIMLCPYTFSFIYKTELSFDKPYISVNENAGNATITINIKNPAAAGAMLTVKAAPFGTATAADFSYTTSPINITSASGTSISFTIPILDDNTAEQDEYFVLALENPTNCSITGSKYVTIYIRDNDRKAPTATKEVELNYVGSFEPVAGNSTCEIVVYDSATKRIFSISSVQKRFDIADFSNPASIQLIKSVNMAPYGGINSIAVKNGIVATACENSNAVLPGSVVFFNTNGDFMKQVTVGVQPDMVTFTPDGKKVLSGDEGQPNDSYTIDPEGSISIIDISGGVANLTQANVTTLPFTAFNSQQQALYATGVRKVKASSTLSQDFEPEYITISPDSKWAYATLQENNAIAQIDIENKTIVAVWGLGTKDHNAFGNGFDACDNNGFVHLANWPVKSYYLADAIGNYAVNGSNHLVFVNEGDEKDYSGFSERTTVGAVKLDSLKFPQREMLQQSHNLGRLRITSVNGDEDNDGDYDYINMVGARSFTIYNTTTKSIVFDSGDEIERITATDSATASIFNADNESNGFKSRSTSKGPEPEGVTIAHISGKTFAFIALERVGGVMAYNISNPVAPTFSDYKNSRNKTTYGGDNGPEGIIYIAPTASPTGKGYVLTANEMSGTVAVFEVKNNLPNNNVGVAEVTGNAEVKFYPNPAASVLNVECNLPASDITVEIYDINGKKVIEQAFAGNSTATLSMASLTNGIYFARVLAGNYVAATEKLVIIK